MEINMRKQGLIACIAGICTALGAMWLPQVARANFTTNQRTYTGKNCAYDNLSCEAGHLDCIICGYGHDTTCKEQATCGLTGGG